MNISEFKPDFEQTIEFLKKDITGLRTGRASTAIVEDIQVEAYGVHQAIKALASITVPDSKTVNIEPWDKTVLSAIEKAIRDSGLGLNPNNNGNSLRISLPDLTTERRAELIKVLHQKLEGAHISLRKIREEIKSLIKASEDAKEIGEDEKYRLQEDLEKLVKEYNEKIDEVGEKKETEINTV